MQTKLFIERMGETNGGARDTFRNTTTNRSMKTTARESQQMNQTQRSGGGNAAVAPSVSVTVSNKGTGGTNTAKTSPKGGSPKGGKKVK